MTAGTLYGVSLGPGDPDLITRRAWSLLNSDKPWAYPVRKRGGDSYALSIVTRSGLEISSNALELQFPMTRDTTLLAKYWLKAAEAVRVHLATGQDLVFLVEGDASTYSTFSHLARTLQGIEPDTKVEVIPGVSSYHAAAAKLDMPLADTDDTFAIVPAAYGIEVIERLLTEFDTLILLKVKPILDDIIDLLDDKGLLATTRFIEKVGAPEERVINDVASLRDAKVNYLSLLLVHNPGRPRGSLIRGCRKKENMIKECA